MAEDAPLLEELVELEQRFWHGGPQVYERYLDEAALMVFPAPVGVLDRAETVASISAGQRWAAVRIDDVLVVPLTEDVAVLTYEATARREDDTTPYRTFATSVYARRPDGWRLALHQQSPPAS